MIISHNNNNYQQEKVRYWLLAVIVACVQKSENHSNIKEIAEQLNVQTKYTIQQYTET
jgi:DNA-binding IscR family transcriptional regulator